jgi:hypothetical protein
MFAVEDVDVCSLDVLHDVEEVVYFEVGFLEELAAENLVPVQSVPQTSLQPCFLNDVLTGVCLESVLAPENGLEFFLEFYQCEFLVEVGFGHEVANV